jgi:hypothetical protein
LYDNVEERHEREVKEAEEAARKAVLENHPDIQAEDLEIKVSDAVNNAKANPAKRKGAHFDDAVLFAAMQVPVGGFDGANGESCGHGRRDARS